ncbi:MAG TPA: TadE/TadG family type IV pilus assembly protein [Bryobacteraceae bacterium]|nr:TadE/TadG family type IV pilus assembly protein [Bryobacteraceae bacterium]
MRRERGHAMLELALSAGVMVSCLAGTFQFGYIFYVYNQLVTAVGNGGRYAAMRTYRAAGAADLEKARAAIRNMVVYGDASPTDLTPAIANLRPENVEVEWVKDSSGAPSAVHVAIRNFPVNAIFKRISLDGRPGVEFPFVGRYAPSESER